MQMYANELDHTIPNMHFAPFPDSSFSTNQKPEKSNIADFWALLYQSEHSRTRYVCKLIGTNLTYERTVLLSCNITKTFIIQSPQLVRGRSKLANELITKNASLLHDLRGSVYFSGNRKMASMS